MKMDLLPRPLGSFTPDVDVPLMEIIPYEEPQDFFSFPQRHNIQFSLYDEKDSHALAILIQSWLFFGLLTESFGDMPELSDLVDTRPVNGKPISCVSLRIYASRIYDEQLSTRLRKAKFQEMIRFAHSQLIHFEKLPCAVQTPVPAVALSTHLLLESLVALSRAIQTHEGLTISSKYLVLDLLWGGRSQFQAPVTSQDVPPSLQLVLDRLFANKWCRAQAKLHFQKFGYMPLYYMSSIHRRHLQEMDHETCRDNICSATTPSDKSLGVPRHRWSRCDCLLQSLPVDQLLNILRQGKIPLVRLTYNQLGRLTLTLEAATTRSRYIAISHVWADGLGNATGNSVYYCQLEQIQRQLSNLPVYDEGVFLAMHTGLFNFDFSRMKFSIGLPDHTSTLFWLDILCIPAKCLSGVQDTDVRRLRKKAVSQIPTVFAGAAQVLVLDAELQTLRLSASQLPEIFAQIIGCNWAKRAWTYQEGAHSLRCRVQLADGAINPLDPSLRSRSWKGFGYQFDDGLATNSSSDMIKLTIRSLLEHDLYCAFKTEISLWFPDNDIDGIPTALDEGPDSEAMTLVRTWNELLLRSTTEASDLVIILAMALRIPLRSLLELPISKRLPSILWSLTQIPLSLLYIPYTEDADSVDRQNTWVLRHIQAPSPRGIYPLAARDYGSFSEGRDCISFNLGTQSDLWLISLAGDMSRVPLLLVKTPLHLYKILFHRQEIAAADVSYSFGKLIVIDPRSAAAESQQFKEPWKAGCSFIIREAHQIGSDAWKLNVIYDSAISALVLDPESEGRGGTYPAQSLSDALAQNIVQQPIHDATDQSSWASSRETSLEICMACSPPGSPLPRLPQRYLVSTDSFGNWLFLVPFVIFYGIRFFSFLAFSVKCDFTGLSLIRKAAFLTWWVGLGLPLLLAPLLLIWIGLLYLKYQWHGKPRGLDSSVFKETCAVHVLPILLLSRFVAKDISPVITWVLMICSRSQGQPYHQSERIFILSSATYYSWVIPTFIFYSAWGYSCRRLWLAFHAVNPMLFSLSIWNLAAWKITFTEGNCLTNLLILLRIYRLWQFLDYSWVVSWFDSWFPEEL